jgi:sphingosine kinase
MNTEIDRKMEEGIGMLLLLEGKKKLTIGIEELELNGADLLKET